RRRAAERRTEACGDAAIDERADLLVAEAPLVAARRGRIDARAGRRLVFGAPLHARRRLELLVAEEARLAVARGQAELAVDPAVRGERVDAGVADLRAAVDLDL